MDTTLLEAKIADLQSKVNTDQQSLQADQDELAKVQNELKFASLVNDLEALSEADVANLNQALNEPSNTLGITVALPPLTGANVTGSASSEAPTQA